MLQDQTQQSYLNIPEAAAILRVSSKSLANDVSRSPSTIPPFFRKGRLVLFPSHLLHDWALSQIANLPNNDHAHLNSVNKKRSAGLVSTNQQTSLSPKRGRPRKSEVNKGGL